MLEEEQQKLKLDKFIANNAEDWDIKNAVCGLPDFVISPYLPDRYYRGGCSRSPTR